MEDAAAKREALLKRLHTARTHARAGVPKAQAAFAPPNPQHLTERMMDAYKSGSMSATMRTRLETLDEELKLCGNDVEVLLRNRKGVRPEMVAPIKAAVDRLSAGGSLADSLNEVSAAIPRAAAAAARR